MVKSGLVEQALKDIARRAVKEALSDPKRVADVEKARQQHVEKGVDASAPASDASKLEPGHYKQEAEDDVPRSGPTRDPEDDAPQPEMGDAIDKDTPADKVTADVIINKLNVIRSGKSLSDSSVEEQFDTYIAGLKSEQKTALFSFLNSIAQIVAGGVAGKAVKEPDDEPYNVKMQRLKDLEKRRKSGEIGNEKPKRYVTTQPSEPVARTSPSVKKGEDTTPPISLGKRNESRKPKGMVID